MLKLFTIPLRRGSFLPLKNSIMLKSHLKSLISTPTVAWKSDLEKPNSLTEKKNDTDLEQRQQFPTSLQNSVSNEDLKIVMVRGLPKPWTEKDLAKYFDKSGRDIQNINVVRNRLGVHTGKALITFKNSVLAEKFIKDWDHNLIETEDYTQQIAVQIFTLKKRENVSHTNYGRRQIYIYNLNFECQNEDLYNFAADFGEVRNIELPTRQTGMNKGYGYITFERVEDANKFLKVADDMDFMGRKVRVTPGKDRYEGKNKRTESYSNLIFKQNQSEDDKIKGENLAENMKLYKEMKGKLA